MNSCIEYQDGYYYNKEVKKCLEMTEWFLNCKYSCAENSSICYECKKDFYLFENDHLCYNNSEEKQCPKQIFIKKNA